MGQPTVPGELRMKLLRMGRANQKIVELPGSFGSPDEAEHHKPDVTAIIGWWFTPTAALGSPSAVIETKQCN